MIARPRHSAELVRVLTLSAAMILAGALLTGQWLLAAEAVPGALSIPTFVLTVLFVVSAMFQLHVEVRRSANSVTFTDIALVIALFSAPPLTAPTLRIATAAGVYAWRYRRSARRALFNVALCWFEAAVAAIVFTVASGNAVLTSPRTWVAAYAAVVASNLVGAALVSFAIMLNDGTFAPTALLEAAGLGVTVGAANCTLALIAVLLLDESDEAGWLVAALFVVVALGYRTYAGLRERHLDLESMFGFTRSVNVGSMADDVLTGLLGEVRDRIRGDFVELYLLEWPEHDGPVRLRLRDDNTIDVDAIRIDEHWPLARVLMTGNPLLLTAKSRDNAIREYVRALGYRELLLAPLRREQDVVGVLAVGDRSIVNVRGFRPDDARLLETMALHAGAALENTRLMDRLRHDARHDALTGLNNRAMLTDLIGASPGRHGAVVLLDLDDFMQVNDTLGYLVGDEVLRRVADRLQASVPAGSALGRVGGDEFAIVLPEAPADEIDRQVNALLESLIAPLDLGAVTITTTATAGVALVEPDVDTAALLPRADIALAAAKRRGDRTRTYDASLESMGPHRLALASDLRSLLAGSEDRGHLVVEYQPQVDGVTGSPISVEALTRWQHPQLGLLAPDVFIEIAESTGLATALTMQVLDQALGHLVEWHADGSHVGVAVNVSARALRSPTLGHDVATALRNHGVAPESLTLEITESCIVDDPAHAADVLATLAQLGVRVSIDDFGTGYSSLAYLARLPVHEVKIDKGFVQRMPTDQRDAAIVRAVVRLGTELDLTVVAEGVEDEDAFHQLMGLGCTRIQGYLFSRPLGIKDLRLWLRRTQGLRIVI